MGRFLIWLSGARWQILDECPTERPKYIGIGASILITATMAAVSLAFALVTALKIELWLALPFAIAWGVAILSLDRLFVVSLSRKGTRRAQLFGATPRVLLALLLGFVISTPFVLQIFRPEIEHEITILHTQAENAYLAGARNSQFQQQIRRYQDQVDRLTAEAGGGGHEVNGPQSAQLQSTLNQLHQAKSAEVNDYNQWQCQLYGSAGGQTCRPAGSGPLATADQQRYENDVGQVAQLSSTASSEQSQLRQTIADAQAKNKAEAKALLPAAQKALQAANAEQTQELDTFTTENENNGGLLIRLQALAAATDRDSTLTAARWLLFLLFVVIDCMPVVIKVMLNLGPENNYDLLLEAEEKKQLRVAANNREFQEAAEMMAAGTLIGEAQSRLAGWSANIPEVTQNIVDARTRVEAKRLDAWENAQTRRLLDGAAVMPGQTADVEPPMGFVAGAPTDGVAARQRGWWESARLQSLRMHAYEVFNNVWRRSGVSQPHGASASGRSVSDPGGSDHPPESPSQDPGGSGHSGPPPKGAGESPPASPPPRQRWLPNLLLSFLLVTVAGSAITAFLQHVNDQKKALDDQRTAILQTYIDNIRDLLLNHKLTDPNSGADVREVARVQTLNTLGNLDADRNKIVLRFLQGANLIKNAVINLSNADLSNDDLSGTDLRGIDLNGANLTGAHLNGADLSGATLYNATLGHADLSGAKLDSAFLFDAGLNGADLSDAAMNNTTLTGAFLGDANMNHACTGRKLCYRC